MMRNLSTKIILLLLVTALSILYAPRSQAQSRIPSWGSVSNWGNANYYMNSGDPGSHVYIDGTFTNNNSTSDEYYDFKGNVELTNGGIFKNNNGNIRIYGDLILDASSTSLFQNNGNIYVYGNIINNLDMSNMAIGAGKIILAGGTDDANLGRSAVQTVKGNQPFITYDLEINNTAAKNGSGNVVLNQSLVVTHTGTFTQGIVTTPDKSLHPLIFDKNSAGAVNQSDVCHVNGVVRTLWATGNFTYPVGDGNKYQKIDALEITDNSAGLDVQYIAGDAGTGTFTNTGTVTTPLLSYAPEEYWNVMPVGTASTKFKVYSDGYRPQSSVVAANLRVAHKVGSNWLNEGIATGGTGTSVADWTVTSNAIILAAGTQQVITLGTGDAPDLTPTLDIDNANFLDGEERDFVVNLWEIMGADALSSTKSIQFVIKRISAFDITVPGITLSATATPGTNGTSNVYGGTPNQNGNWMFSQSGSFITVTAKPGVDILAGGNAQIGFHIKRKAGTGHSSQGLSVVITNGSGGDVNNNNNTMNVNINTN